MATRLAEILAILTASFTYGILAGVYTGRPGSMGMPFTRATCDTVDYTLPMTEAFTKHSMGIEEDELMLIEGFRSWYATRGLSFDIAKK